MSEKMHPGLRDLRQKVKEVMIPLLVEVFEAKLAAQSSSLGPSRLRPPSLKSRDQICGELEALQEDVRLLLLWSQSCEKQIGKALNELKEKPKPNFQYSLAKETNPDVTKSFSEAIAASKPIKRSPSLFDLLRQTFRKLFTAERSGR